MLRHHTVRHMGGKAGRDAPVSVACLETHHAHVTERLARPDLLKTMYEGKASLISF